MGAKAPIIVKMILFEEDWSRYPGSRPHYETRNKSFLRFSRLLYEMEIKNCLWPLALINPNLKDVDPHDPNLPEEIKIQVIEECHLNPIYALREVIRVPAAAGGGAVFFESNRGNMAAFWCYFVGIDFTYIQIRQTGKTTFLLVLYIILLYLVLFGSKIVLITKDNQLRYDNIAGMKEIREYLPAYLNGHRKGLDPDNQQELQCSLRKTKLLTGVGRRDEVGANNLGRGLTATTMGFDEAPFTPRIDVTIPAANAAGVRARDDAKAAGEPCCSFVTTTAGSKDTIEGKYIYNLTMDGMNWTEHCYDQQNKEQLEKFIYRNSSNKSVYLNLTFGHKQLGKSDEWLYRNVRQSKGTRTQINKDFFNQWDNGASNSPLTIDDRDAIARSKIPPLYENITDKGYLIKWYVNKDDIKRKALSEKWIMGLDTSDAVGADDIAMVITNAATLETVAVARCNETFVTEFALWVADILIEQPNTTVIIEKKSSSATFVETMITKLIANNIDPFSRMFNMLHQERDERERDYAKMRTMSTANASKIYKRMFGFNTTRNTRDTLYGEVLTSMVKNASSNIYDEDLASQIVGLEERNGRIDHSNGNHDDLVIAWLLTGYLIFFGKHLDEYGLGGGYVLSKLKAKAKEETFDQVLAKMREEHDNNEINKLLTAMDECDNHLEFVRLQHRLDKLQAGLSNETKSSYSVDNIINSYQKDASRHLSGFSERKNAAKRMIGFM